MTHEIWHIGLYVIFGIVLLPVYAMFVGWLLGRPWDIRSIAVALGYMAVFLSGVIIGALVLDVILSVVTGR